MTGCCGKEPAGGAEPRAAAAESDAAWNARFLGLGALALAAWWLVYRSLLPFAKWFTHSALSLAPGTRLSSSVEFFVYDAPKVMMLLALVVFGVGIVRSFFTPERTRRILAGKGEFTGNVMASLLGVVTPFCTCSAIPLFLGFVTAGVPLGVTFSFLVSAPMVNEIALVLLFGLFGWKVAAIYAGTGLAIAMAAGWIIGRLRMEKHLEDWVFESLGAGGGPGDAGPDSGLSWRDRVRVRAGRRAGDRREGLAVGPGGDRRRGGDPRVRPRELHGPDHGERAPGGPSRWPSSSASRCIRTRRGSSRWCRRFSGKGRRWGRCSPS